MYGPGNAVGRRTFTIQKKRQAKLAKKGKTTAKAVTQAVKSVVLSQSESKYVAENIIAVPIAVPAGQSTVGGVNMARMIPRLTQGSDDYQRNGNRILPYKARTIFNLNITNPLNQLIDLTVNIVIFKVKGASTDTAIASVPGGDFLRVGNGANVDPSGPPGVSNVDMLNFYNNYRVNSERYTLLKWKKILFKKGPNDANGIPTVVNGPPTVLGAKLHRKFSYTWEPPQLRYDNAAATLPTNHYPVYMIWSTPNDGTPHVNSVFFTVRGELLFKDP